MSEALDGRGTVSLRIGVVVPHYDDERRLRWVLNALGAQSYPLDLMHVVVADDGSPGLPVLPEVPFRCDLVQQEDLGFRAAAARNLGAAVVAGDLLVFLDGDTIPHPGYLAAMAHAFEDVGPGMLAVGRREHADFTGCADVEIERWVRDGVPEARALPAPAWLREGYIRTSNLREAGEEDFRLVISAVLAMDRTLFERVGGFDPSLTGYGGEDWELAWRCWLLGAKLRHVPDAVAWHDGPDAADREGDRSASRAVKDAETLALAARITLPSARGRGLVWAQPDIAVSVHGRHTDAQLFLMVMSLLCGSDAGVWLTEYGAVPVVFTADPRVHAGAISSRVRHRARFQVDVSVPLRLDGLLVTACKTSDIDVPGVLRIQRTRHIWLGEADLEPSTLPAWVQELENEGLEQLLGRWNADD